MKNPAQFWVEINTRAYRELRNWVPPAAIERAHRKLGAMSDGDRQMVDVHGEVLMDGLSAVEAACAEAIDRNVHSADVILNILTRRRDPRHRSRS